MYAVTALMMVFAQVNPPRDLPKDLFRPIRPAIEINIDKLPKFKQPIQKPPQQRPPARAGHSWHWHPYRGWIALPLQQAPRTVILPQDYVIRGTVIAPPRVTYVQCPHCGNTFQVELD